MPVWKSELLNTPRILYGDIADEVTHERDTVEWLLKNILKITFYFKRKQYTNDMVKVWPTKIRMFIDEFDKKIWYES